MAAPLHDTRLEAEASEDIGDSIRLLCSTADQLKVIILRRIRDRPRTQEALPNEVPHLEILRIIAIHINVFFRRCKVFFTQLQFHSG